MQGTLAGRELAVRAEWADTASWLDQYRAAPVQVAAGLQLAHAASGDLVMVRSAVPFSHFNMVLTLGCPAAVTASAWRAIEEFYNRSSGHWLVTNDHSEPSDLSAMLSERGYAPSHAWDRIVLQHARPDAWSRYAGGVEIVTAQNASAWIAFVRDCYGMPPIVGDWLAALADRAGWIHAILRRQDRVVMARSAFLHDGWAWLGIDAPIPGIMAPCFDDDQRVSAALLLAAAERGARRFVTDIEVPNDARSGPGYDQWGQLGFEPVYLRTVHRHQ